MELYIMMFLVGGLFSLVGLIMPYLKTNKDENAEKKGIGHSILGIGALMFIISGIAGSIYVSWSWILIMIGIIELLIIGIQLINTLRW